MIEYLLEMSNEKYEWRIGGSDANRWPVPPETMTKGQWVIAVRCGSCSRYVVLRGLNVIPNEEFLRHWMYIWRLLMWHSAREQADVEVHFVRGTDGEWKPMDTWWMSPDDCRILPSTLLLQMEGLIGCGAERDMHHVLINKFWRIASETFFNKAFAHAVAFRNIIEGSDR